MASPVLRVYAAGGVLSARYCGSGGKLSGDGRKQRPTSVLRRPYRPDQRPDAHDIDDAFDIVGEHMQRHLGGDMLQRLHLEVGVAHP